MSNLPYRTPDAPPKLRLPLLGKLSVKTPCKVSWESMEGDERMRFCCSCSKNVFDLSAMTEDESESFLAVHLDDDEDACVRLYRRPDGRILTSDCPVGATKRHRRHVVAAASVAAVAITAVSAAVGDLDVPRAHSPLHDTQSRFEPPHLVSVAPTRVWYSPLDLPPSPPPQPPRTAPTVRQGFVEVNGALPVEVVTRVVRQNFGRFRLCYERGLLGDPKLQGRVTTKFVIGTDGSVIQVADADSDLHDRATVACVVRSFDNLSFPTPERRTVTVKFPIVFNPGD